MWQRFFHAFLMALLLLGWVAWAQGQDDLQDQGQQQPLQTDMVDNDQPNLDLSIDRPNSKAKDRKAARVTDIKKSTESGSPKAESFRPSSKQYGMSNAQSKGPQVGALGSGPINQSSNFGSKSFLDGYLINSLHNEGMARKKPGKEEKPKDNLR